MEASRLLDYRRPGSKIEMIRISKNNLRTDLFEFAVLNGFDIPKRADRHENRCFDGSVIGLQDSRPGTGQCVGVK